MFIRSNYSEFDLYVVTLGCDRLAAGPMARAETLEVLTNITCSRNTTSVECSSLDPMTNYV